MTPGKSPKGILSKAERHRQSSMSPKRRLARAAWNKEKYFQKKRNVLKQIYAHGMGTTFFGMIAFLRDAKEGITQIPLFKDNLSVFFTLLSSVEKHYKNTYPLFRRYKGDPDFEVLFLFHRTLPRIRRYAKEFQRTNSEESYNLTRTLLIDLGKKFLPFNESIIRDKYGLGDFVESNELKFRLGVRKYFPASFLAPGYVRKGNRAKNLED